MRDGGRSRGRGEIAPALLAIGLLAMGLLGTGCSGSDTPPPPPPPTPPETTAPETTTPEAPPTEAPPTPSPTETAPATPPPPRVPRTLGLSYAGGCAIHDGRVSCWGESPRADEDEVPTARPEVQLTGDFVDLVSSDFLACARRSGAGGLSCFGDGSDLAEDARALAQDDEDEDEWDGEDETSELDLASDALAGAIDVAFGMGNACMVRRSGERTSVACGGESFEPRALEGIRGTEGVVEVCVGESFACGRTATGEIRCWGDNEVGQLGDGLESEHAESASGVRGLEGVLHIACGDAHACALRGDGTVWCWGDNAFGELARGPEIEFSREPVRIGGLENVRAVVAGGASGCALFDEGPPRCWGANESGQLGNGSTRHSDAPVEARELGRVSELALGPDHACGVRGEDASREVVCWGLGEGGALGPRARRREFAPVEPFPALTTATRVAVGHESICVLVGEADSGEVRCTGRAGADDEGGLEAARVPRTVPREQLRTYPALSTLFETAAPQRFATQRWLCTLASQSLECHPIEGGSRITVEDVTAAGASTSEVCAVHASGALECATDGGSATLTFAPVTDLPPASAVAWLGARCVVTREDGSLVCAGRREGWHSGTEPYPPPAAEDAGPPAPGAPRLYRYAGVRDVARVVSSAGVVVTRDGRVLCISTGSAPVPLLDRVISVHAASAFTCALRTGDAGGEAWCWGANTVGQLARADDGRSASGAPVLIPGLAVPLPEVTEGAPPVDLARHGVVELAASIRTACARLSDGRVLCWGSDADGQLGRAPETLRLRPVVVLD